MRKQIAREAAMELCAWRVVFLCFASEVTEATSLYTPAVSN